MSEQVDKVIQEFTKQSETFDTYQQTFSKAEYNDFAVAHMGLAKADHVLEVAAGTCAFGRLMAPHVADVTELDATAAMLEVGRRQAEAAGLTNVRFVQGLAEHLPFEPQSFDVVASRLAFHHFENPATVFGEMGRVLRPGGRLVVIDMAAREESLRTTADSIERLRDPSHTRCLPEDEFRALAAQHHLEVSFCQTIHVPVALEAWMDVTQVQEPTRSQIGRLMREDIDGGAKTGFEPYLKEGAVYFDHRWMLMVCTKGERA